MNKMLQHRCLRQVGHASVRYLTLALAAFTLSFMLHGCDEESDSANRPEVGATSTPYAPQVFAPAGGVQPNPAATTAGDGGGAAGNGGQGVGCVGDAEPVPKEEGLRECCSVLKMGNACNQSVCWANGLVAKIKAQMQPGGKCAN